MTVISWDDLVARKTLIERPVDMTIGFFDGLHVGHRKLLEQILDGRGLPLVITFRQGKLKDGDPIMSYPQKLEVLESLGIGGVVVIDFSEQLSRLSGKAFVDLLRENLTIEKFAVGYNFRFGRGRDTDVRALRELLKDAKTDVREVEPVLYRGEPVSSSRVRLAIRDARFSDASDMLGRAYRLDLRDVPMTGGRRAGPRVLVASRNDIRQCLPKPGSYPVSFEAEAAAGSGLLTVREDSTVELELDARGKIMEARFQSKEES